MSEQHRSCPACWLYRWFGCSEAAVNYPAAWQCGALGDAEGLSSDDYRSDEANSGVRWFMTFQDLSNAEEHFSFAVFVSLFLSGYILMH